MWDQSATAPVMPPTVSGGAPSGLTVLTPHPYAAISEQMVGWILQPNINVQAYAPIVDVDVQNHKLSVGGKFDQIAQQGVRYRIYAPPGVRRTQQNTGTLDKFVAAQGTRCLYAGYRWESPYAGWQEFGITQWLDTEWRQEEDNFTGLYYTLHRHYDPNLMRFTSPDPIASPFYNLYTYTGANPARYYDPDGLMVSSEDGRSKNALVDAMGLWGLGKKIGDWMDENLDPGPSVGDWAVKNPDEFQTALGVAGQVPIAGEVADIFNAGISFLRGDTAGGLMDLSAAIPILGNVTGATNHLRRSSRVVKTLLKNSDEAGDAARTVTRNSDEVANTARRMGEPACFVAGTLVPVCDENGGAAAKTIEEIAVGDWVWSRNEETGKEGFKPVVEVFRNTSDALVHLTYTTGSRRSQAHRHA